MPARVVTSFVKNVTDRVSNPFGMRPPFERQDPGERPAAFGYGDANADFHLIGDHPGVHGGASTGIPFTDSTAGDALYSVFRETEFVSGPRDEPLLDNLFMSYIHMCTLPDGRQPTAAEYAELERYFDAELRAINAHVLLPVGERAIDHVLTTYTTQRSRFDDLSSLHATEIRGRGFMVVPVADPSEWGRVPADGVSDERDGEENRGEPTTHREALVARIDVILSSDYRQTKGVATRVG